MGGLADKLDTACSLVQRVKLPVRIVSMADTGKEPFSYGGVVLSSTTTTFNGAFLWDAPTMRFTWNANKLKFAEVLAASQACKLEIPFAACGRLLFTYDEQEYNYSGLFISSSRFVTSCRFMRRVNRDSWTELLRHPVLISSSAFAPSMEEGKAPLALISIFLSNYQFGECGLHIDV